jgi:hypothetical protein
MWTEKLVKDVPKQGAVVVVLRIDEATTHQDCVTISQWLYEHNPNALLLVMRPTDSFDMLTHVNKMRLMAKFMEDMNDNDLLKLGLARRIN